jgi:tetratricopeptide (TPR) repeat protein
MNPHDLEAAYVNLISEGAILFGERNHEAALAVFWKAFRLRPSAPVVLFNIGRTMEELKDPRAEDFYAAAATQGNVDASYQLATLCVSSGRNEEAVEHLRAYLEGTPVNDSCTQWARRTLHRIQPTTGLSLVWNNPEISQDCCKKLPEKGNQREVMFGIL